MAAGMDAEAAMRDLRTVSASLAARMSDLENERDEAALAAQVLVRSLAAENAEISERMRVWEGGRADAEAREEEARSVAARLAAAEADVADLTGKFAVARLEREEAIRGVAEAGRRAAEDAAVIKSLREREAEYSQFRSTAEARFVSNSAEALRLSRESREGAGDVEASLARTAFLERERARMTGELAEARSQLDIANAQHTAELKSTQDQLKECRDELASSKSRAQLAANDLLALEQQVADVQSQREQARADSLRETTQLSSLVEMYRQSAKEAETRMAEYKELVATLAANQRSENARARPDGKINAHAEVLLERVQVELDAKLEDLEQQRKQMNSLRELEARTAVKYQSLLREAEEARRAASEASARAASAEAENKEFKRKVAKLENRILLAGDISSGAMAVVSPSYSRGALMRAAPSAAMQTPATTGYRMLPSETAPLSTSPNFSIVPVNEVDAATAAASPVPMDVTPTRASLQTAMQEMIQLRRKHEGILSSLAAKRESFQG